MPAYRISLGFSAKKPSHFCMDFHVRGLSPFKRFAEIAHGTYIHTYIHTLLARPHGAFQSQFYITKL